MMTISSLKWRSHTSTKRGSRAWQRSSSCELEELAKTSKGGFLRPSPQSSQPKRPEVPLLRNLNKPSRDRVYQPLPKPALQFRDHPVDVTSLRPSLPVNCHWSFQNSRLH